MASCSTYSPTGVSRSARWTTSGRGPKSRVNGAGRTLIGCDVGRRWCALPADTNGTRCAIGSLSYCATLLRRASCWPLFSASSSRSSRETRWTIRGAISTLQVAAGRADCSLSGEKVVEVESERDKNSTGRKARTICDNDYDYVKRSLFPPLKCG